MSEILKFTLNSQPVEVLVKPEESLLEVLRDKLRVVSPKCGCDRGDCGACTVMVDGKAVKSCATLALTIEGRSVLTVEGLSNGTELHPIQKAFIEMGAPQCGICTPGFVMASVAFLQSNPSPHQGRSQRSSGWQPLQMLRLHEVRRCRSRGFQGHFW